MEKHCCSKHPDREAIIYCSHSDCDKCLCAGCEEEHSVATSVDHKDYIVRNIGKGKALISKCKNHPKHPQNLLCKMHWELCCSECRKYGNAHHKCLVCPLNSVKMEEIEKALSKAERIYVGERDKLCGSPLSSLETKIENFHREIEEKRETLTNYFDTLRRIIDQKESELLDKLEEISENENELTGFMAGINDEDESLLNHEDIESAPSEMRKRKLARRIGRIKEETKKLSTKFAKVLDYLAGSTEIAVIFNNSVPGLILSADVKQKKKVDEFRVTKTGATISEISLCWTQVQAENVLYHLEITNTAINKQISSCFTKDTSFTAQNLEPNTAYSFRVRPKINGTYGNWSGDITVMTEPLGVPQNFRLYATGCDQIQASWDETKYAISYQLEMKRKIDTDFKEVFKGNALTFTKNELGPETEYLFRVRAMFEGERYSAWSKKFTARTKDIKDTQRLPSRYAWKKCPQTVWERKRYQVSDTNSRIATNAYDNDWCTILGKEPIQGGRTVGYGVKILNSTHQCEGIYIGVTHRGINQGADRNFNKRGWYLHCFGSTLWSGPPHNYKGENYGPKRENINVEDTVGVVMDTIKGELSFVVKGVNLDVAYKGIPLDEPFIPCVILKWIDDSVELDLSGAKENVDSSVPVPNVESESITWDSTMVSWSAVEGAQFYQVEKNLAVERSTTKRQAIYNKVNPDEECKFRVRAIVGNRVSEWSDFARAKGQQEPFELSKWMECPSNVVKRRKYTTDEKNSRIATKTNDSGYCCTIIGSIPIPLKETFLSWSVKILKSRDNNGKDIAIGVAPFKIDQNDDNYSCNKCGWYFDCYYSTLTSGPPHNYDGKEYGPRKEGYGEYIRTGDSVGVVVDTTKGEVSFVLNGVNLGVAYCGIPLDKPLVPCVILYNKGDSVELDLSEVKENVDSSIPVPSNITTEGGVTWDTITLTWDKVVGASFYQIEVDGNKTWDITTDNEFIKRSLPPETEHSFRVRTVRGSSVGGWSSAAKTKFKETFKESLWKECPEHVDDNKKYVVNNNARIATKINNIGFCTILGSAAIPLRALSSWSVKILKSEHNNGDGIYIGIAPFDTNQNNADNYNKCGWYFYCCNSSLWSGPPHNYRHKEYGPKKRNGQCVHTGDSVGVVVDTTKGELSFVLNGADNGVAFEGIPLDKPLVPCVLLKWEGDSVELIISEENSGQAHVVS